MPIKNFNTLRSHDPLTVYVYMCYRLSLHTFHPPDAEKGGIYVKSHILHVFTLLTK